MLFTDNTEKPHTQGHNGGTKNISKPGRRAKCSGPSNGNSQRGKTGRPWETFEYDVRDKLSPGITFTDSIMVAIAQPPGKTKVKPRRMSSGARDHSG